MKNPELKSEFYRKLKREDPYVSDFFGKLLEFEEKFNKDLYEFSADEIQVFVNRSFGGQKDPVTRALSVIRQYTRFAQHKLPGVEDLRNYRYVKTSEVDELWATTFASPEHFEDALNQTFCPVDANNADICLRCFLWAAYMEIDDHDIISLTNDAVDFKRRDITVSGHKYPMYKQSIPAFKKACTLKEFEVVSPKNSHTITRVDNNLLLRGKMTAHSNSGRELNSIRTEIARVNQWKSQSFSYNSVRYSGMFFRVYQKELAGKPIDAAKDFTIFENRRKKAELTDEHSVSRREYRELLGIRNKYKAWKNAFHSEK